MDLYILNFIFNIFFIDQIYITKCILPNVYYQMYITKCILPNIYYQKI